MHPRRLAPRLRPIASRSLLALVLLGAGAAQTAPSVSAREIFELSSLRPQLEVFGLQLDQLVSVQQNIPPATLDVVRTVVARQYSRGALEAEIVPRMRARQDEELAAATLAWLRSPIGRKITALDVAASSSEAVIAIQPYLEELRQHPAPSPRLKLVERMIAVSHYSEARTDLGLAMIEALILTLDATRPAGLRTAAAEVSEKIASTRADALLEGEELWRAAMLYAYRSLPSSDLEKLLAFAESDAGRWYHETVWKSAKEALHAISLEAQAAIVAQIPRLPASDAP